MKKQEMIDTILAYEHELYKTLNEFEDIYGLQAEEVKPYRSRWYSVNVLCEKLGIISMCKR